MPETKFDEEFSSKEEKMKRQWKQRRNRFVGRFEIDNFEYTELTSKLMRRNLVQKRRKFKENFVE